MSDSDSSDTFDESSVGCVEYDIEDECSEMTSRNDYKHDPSHAVEDTQDHTQDHTQDDMPYTDEPLADESWVEEYERRQGEHDREMNELSLRLNGQNHVDSW